MRNTRIQDQEELNRQNERLLNLSGNNQTYDIQNDQILYQQARDKLKGRLYETGVQQQNMPMSMQKPIFQPNTIIPKRVIQGYKFYQNRQQDSTLTMRAKPGNVSNLNNLSSLVDQSMMAPVNKSIRLPKIIPNLKDQSLQHRRSRSVIKPAKEFEIIPKNLLEDSPEGERTNMKGNNSFGGMSPIIRGDHTQSINKKIGRTFETLIRLDDELDINSSNIRRELNLTYNEDISKRIIGKLTGKNLTESRPQNGRFLRSNSVRSRGLSFATEDEAATINQIVNEGQTGKINQLQDIDSFIYLIKEGKINPAEFIYLVRKESDHYNLKVTDYCSIKDKIYWTLSAKGVTKFDNNFPVEFISLKDWLRERDQYNHIKRLQFFKQFRSWKTLKKWVKILRSNQRNSIKAKLNEKLFIANHYFQKIIRQHKEYCLEIENLRFVDVGNTYGQYEVQKLDDFKTNQEKKRAEIVAVLQEYSDKLHDNARGGIKKILEKLRDHIIDEMAHDEDKGQDELRDIQEQKNQLNNKNVFETLGFPEFMNYGHRSMLRRECTRFLRLAYLLDFMAVEALGNMYLGSATDLVTKFKELCDLYEEGPKVIKYPKKQYIEPLFSVNVTLKFHDVDPKDIQLLEIGPEITEPEDFDLETYASYEKEIIISEEETKSPVKKGKKAKEERVVIEEPEEIIYKKRSVKNLAKKWFHTSPGLDTFKREFEAFFETAIESIQVIERWSKHSEFQPYADALEEWDEIIGEKWIMPENKYLSILWYLKENPNYKIFRHHIEQMFDVSFKRTDSLLQEYNYYLEFYWRDKNTDLSILANDRLKNQNFIFGMLYKLSKMLMLKFEENMIASSDIGLFRIQLGDVRKVLVPKPAETVDRLELLLPDILRLRTQKMREWLVDCIRKLSGIVAGIEEFIDQKNSFNKITVEYESKRPLIDSLYEFMGLMQDLNIPLANEDRDQFNKLGILIADLSTALQNVEMSTNKNSDKFQKTLTEKISKLLVESTELREQLIQGPYLDPVEKIETILGELSKIDQQVSEYEKTSDSYKFYEEVLQVQEYGDFSKIDDLRNELNLRMLLWKCKHDWEILSKEWMGIAFNQINAKELGQQADIYAKNIYKCEKNLPESSVIRETKKKIYDFRDTMPVVTALRSQYLKDTHWDEIKKVLKQDFNIEDETFTLNKLMLLNVAAYQEDILNIATQATQEFALEIQITSVEEFWRQMDLTIESYKGLRDTYIIKDVDLILTPLDEYLSTMSNILASRYVKNLRPRAEKIQGDLLILSDVLDKWLECQKKWMYLENIFSAPDIKKQLAEENNMFISCDKNLKNLFKRALLSSNTMRIIKIPNIIDILNKTSDMLDIIERRLEDYLELKRGIFPRFYFISNDELLEILAKSQNVDAVQKHLRKCFENIIKIQLSSDGRNQTILAMVSGEDEVVPFNKASFQARGQVETWLDALQKNMYEILQKLIKEGLNDFTDPNKFKTRNSWVLAHYGQIVSVVSHIHWCNQTEEAINEMANNPGSLEECFDTNLTNLSQLTELVRSNITSLQRKIVVALITQDVHARDIVEKLKNDNVESTSNFLWQQQLRYTWDYEKETCLVKQVTAVINYGYEYLGATSRLVITPLTDRCWITITGALAMQLGAAPAGPAGTGKTESTKDLAKGLGQLCVVFNCSDQITTAMMSKLFSGLAQQGAWACLDEFNRIDVEVLSVIAQQLLTVRLALMVKAPEFNFEGRTIPLKKTFGCFITMNPGYAGRTELPDNLKLLFRPVSMMIPDYGLIAEIMLFAEGFKNAKNLSKKMVQLYKLSSEQLSQQDHYDFGMRAVKSVLVMAGALKRAEKDLDEDVVLIRAMRDSNVPKFIKEDLPLFSALIQDLFPGVEIPEKDYGALQTQIVDSISDLGLQRHPEFELKVVQLFETMNVRFGVMIVGPTGSGKSKCYRVLQNAMTQLRAKKNEDQRFQKINVHFLNPKSISMGELYGEIDPYTQEWRDGLAASIVREANLEDPEDTKRREWVVFDGPVDALWIENMNTVLDDNMTLCLANSERIKLRNELRMLFEVQDLAVASPATVSRCGMVYMNHDCLGWFPMVKSWMEKHYPNDSVIPHRRYYDFIMNLFQNTVDACFNKLKHHIKEPIPTVQIQMAANICNFLYALLKKEVFKGHENIDETKKKLSTIFAFSFIWGIGGSLDESTHDRFDTIVKDIFKTLLFPKGENVFDYFIDEEIGYAFNNWEVRVEDFEYVKDTPYFQLMVPTGDTTKFSSVMDLLISTQKPTFLTGVTGVGKSIITQNLLFKLKETKSIIPVMMSFSAQTASKETQMTIENKLNKKTKTVIGARPGEKIAIFIDDINMPLPESYGAQPPIELLRQYLDFGGLYDRDKLFWKVIDDTVLVCVAAPPGGGRNSLTPRFTRHFNILCAAKQNEKTLQTIFGKILQGFLDVWKFPEAVRKSADNLVRGTIEIYTKISQDLLPTPSKFHYTFNLRDISKVFQGILMVKPQSCSTNEDIVKLWLHENSRVFGDRLINNEDREWFGKLAASIISRTFSLNWTYENLFIESKITFGDLLKLEAPQRLYEEIKDRDKLLKVLNDKQEEHNMNSTTKLTLVFFEDAVDHIVRISRILRQPRGNAMLIGVGGSGKQSLARLASFLLNSEIFQIELTKNYNKDSFKQDLMALMVKTGADRQSVTFMFTDSQIADEIFLEYINNMLNSGEVPNLFTKKEDIDEIIHKVRPYNKQLKRVDANDVIYATFIQTVQDNLHIVLCMSPVGENLRVWCRKFPSLVNCCTLDWFSPWPEDALVSVAYKMLTDVDFPKDEIRRSLAQMACEINLNVASYSKKFFDELRRRVYNTPKSYLDSINLYINILQKKRGEYGKMLGKLKEGIEKLKSTNVLVAELQISLKELQPQLEEQTKKTEVFLKKLAEDTEIANEKERVVQKEVEIVNKQQKEIKVVADDAEAELNKALPALKEAEEALKGLDSRAISEIKTFTNPPDAVKYVMEAVCLLLTGDPGDWSSAKQLLMGTDFLERLNTYDRNSVPENVLKKLKNYVSKPEFEPEYVGKKNLACKSICLWCRAIDNYCRVNKEVEPKKKKMAEMNAKLDIANSELAKRQAELDKVRNALAKLQRECDDTMQKKENLMNDMELTKNRVENAQKLTGLLADEGVRWREQVASLDVEYIRLIGNVFVSASLISYLGPFTGKYRNSMIEEWLESMKAKEIPMLDEFSLANIAGDPIKIREWSFNGLPTDTISVDNAIITSICSRWPLLIDPQIQANKWIKNTEKNNNLIIMKFSDGNLLKNFQGAIASGYPVLIEDIDERMEPSIDPILQKAISNVDGRRLIRVGDANVDYHPQFRLYFTTKLPNPHYLPEVCIRVTLINFTVTFDGLQDQLLGDVVKRERPDVEKQRDEIVVTVSGLKKSLKDLQDKILDMLANSKGMILDDVNLIETLEDSKKKSAEVIQNLAESQEVEKVINETRSSYIPVAIRGSILYFVVSDLAGIDPMYQNSLLYFKKLFNLSIETSPKSDDLPTRLDTLIKNITKNVYVNVCRGLFEAHKKIFSFLICTSINRNKGSILENEWNLFLRGPPQTAKPLLNMPNPDSKLISQNCWEFLQYLGRQFKGFENAHEDFKTSMPKWENFIFSEDLYNESIAGFDQIEEFKKLLIIRALKPEQLVFSVVQYVSEQMGKFYEEAATATMDDVFNDSDCKTPVIFILSQGADPSDQLIKFSKDKGFDQTFAPLSLGQGQGKKAEELIERAKKEGSWVLLQNCHLCKSWMPSLEKIVEHLSTLGKDEIHKDFRLWLTSMPTEYFPVSVLQNGLKLTTEPPRGLKANLKRSYLEYSQNFIDECQKPKPFRKLLFGLTFFHAILQERRKFGPLGFNIRYEFNTSDLDVSCITLRMFLDLPSEDIPWDAMLYVTGHINYGGRVTDNLDRTCLLSILKKYYTAEIFADDYWFSDSGIYFAPPDGVIDVYRDYIDKLPLNDTPEVFGMHENANITYLTQESNKILDAVLSIQPRLSDSSQEKSTDDIVIDIAKALLKDLPVNMNKDLGNKKLFEQNEIGLIPSLSTVLLQEMQKFNTLLNVIRNSLDQLQKAIKGFVVMSSELDQMYTAFLNNQLPQNWKKVSYPSLKPLGSWYLDLLERVKFMDSWLMNDNPAAYWMSGFFFPQGFMTGVLQTHSRKYKIAIDKLSFKFKVLNSNLQLTNPPVDGVYIYGLFMDGGRWDESHQTMADQNPGELFTKMPPIHFNPTEGYVTSDDDYQCPVYKTSVRAGVLSTTGQSTNFILPVDLPTKNERSEFWTLRGTALLCQLDT